MPRMDEVDKQDELERSQPRRSFKVRGLVILAGVTIIVVALLQYCR